MSNTDWPTRVVMALERDGTPRGNAVYMAYEMDGVVYERPLPRAITSADSAALAAVLDPAHTAALATVDAQAAQITAHEAAIQTLTSERDAARAERDALQAQLAVSQADDVPAAIRMERDRRILGGVKLGDHWFHSDMQFQIQILGMVIMGANLPAQTTIKTMAGDVVQAAPQLVQQIFGATAQQMAALHAIADAAIAAGTPLASIQWPQTYAESIAA